MSLTRDQLRAARVLLHLQQTDLAEIAGIGVATIRRFEGGKDVGHLYLDALRRAVTEAGVILIDGGVETSTPPGAVGVALRPARELPTTTRARIGADQALASTTVAEARVQPEEASPVKPKPGGKPLKQAVRPAPGRVDSTRRDKGGVTSKR